MAISIIIPTYNEENSIPDLLKHLFNANKFGDDNEIIVVDGGSSDRTFEIVQSLGFRCIQSDRKGRAAQMNVGAEQSSNDILYFVHADSFPPVSYIDDINESLEMGFQSGCYRYKFDHYPTPLLRINSYCTRFDRIMVRGGDQTLFITRSLFDKLGGFREDFRIMEDYDLIEKIQNTAEFRIIQKDAIVSSRKYEDNGYFRVQIANLTVFMMYFAGASQEMMCHAYSNMLDYR
ncbi:MAG TPA: glycosyl transferase [Balneola sp.]|jgi:rSAM/selenodomain-associated transferase 2|nr:glycosyl transferase [Balneola sp.]MAO78156.1 glycosyl transferase [Balneola sp.]MBF64157.1 glycosyl transferase [Balneola sp.]HAW78650.1 glycosyl transferase [Balneola sp.]HBZ40196.1 glycosyl transferase [Balneola sp.]|tara:strand:- start:321 stop:1019 length:699 start_codon:yes stop_codon:yes gene_type:complete